MTKPSFNLVAKLFYSFPHSLHDLEIPTRVTFKIVHEKMKYKVGAENHRFQQYQISPCRKRYKVAPWNAILTEVLSNCVTPITLEVHFGDLFEF